MFRGDDGRFVALDVLGGHPGPEQPFDDGFLDAGVEIVACEDKLKLALVGRPYFSREREAQELPQLTSCSRLTKPTVTIRSSGCPTIQSSHEGVRETHEP